jgi:DNA mismatch endonuclease (patch repair protein)
VAAFQAQGMSETTPARSRIMRAIKSRDTAPELLVRRLAHSMGYRFRVHRKNLPGTPDLVFPARRKAIFVHGCFWHSHDCGRGARVPKQNRSYWKKKLARNEERDEAARKALTALGWKVSVLWECELRNRKRIERKLRVFLR